MDAGKFARGALGATALLVLASSAASGTPAKENSAEPVEIVLLREEVSVAGLLEELRAAPAPEIVVLRNVRVVDPIDETVRDAQSVVVSLGAIYWVGDTAKEPALGDVLVIDGKGLYASPGLVDSHVHTESSSSYLLNIANGVTTVREMDGFPWMLAAREAVNHDRMLGPVQYVAGTIVNYVPYEHYFTTARDALEARRIVRRQAACGYDFIKVHNVLPQRVFDPLAAEAKRVGMDLVGHVPHNMSVRHAADMGMRTMEHLKGFLNDATLTLGDTDYAAASRPDVWIDPTLYAGRAFSPADDLPAMLDAHAACYVPARVRAQWRNDMTAPDNDHLKVARRAEVIKRDIIAALQQQKGVRFLAGTDAAGYGFHTMGFALIEELKLLEQAGLSRGQVLRAATTEPAAAMRADEDFGRIAKGMRADIVLLSRNPLEDLSAYDANDGVMTRGRWLSREKLDGALQKLAALYADDAPAAADLNLTRTKALASQAETAAAAGFVFNDRTLASAASALSKAGYSEAAERLLRLAAKTATCGAVYPAYE